MENLTDGSEVGTIASKDFSWFIIFEFEDSGCISDSGDDADIDADGILNSFREGIKESNKIKAEKGWSTTELIGWSVPPHYNRDTNNLEWGLVFRSDGVEYENYNVRLLGREGVMKVILVGDNDVYQQAMKEARVLVDGYSFTEGKTYAEFRQGDKMAGYGLAALIGGGALAAGAKSGLLGKIAKPLWAALAVAGAYVLNFFRKLFGKKPKDE